MHGQDRELLVVKVELWPGGRESGAREIGRAAIVNISSLNEVSDYLVIAADEMERDRRGSSADTDGTTASGTSWRAPSPPAAQPGCQLAGRGRDNRSPRQRGCIESSDGGTLEDGFARARPATPWPPS